MEGFVSDIKSLNYSSKNFKYVMTFIISMSLFFVMSPGVIFEINPKESNVKVVNKIDYLTALVHSVIFGVMSFVIYYFYLGKSEYKIGSI